MTFQYQTLARLKSLARQIQAEQGIKHHAALDLAARCGGFACYIDAKRKLAKPEEARFMVRVKQHWWGYESRDGGTAEAVLLLKTALPELVRPHHLTGYLGSCRIRDNEMIEREGHQRHAREAQWYLGRVARSLQFMDATGLKPTHARKCYPNGDWDNRAPVADHDHCWFDPVARIHVLSTEPYPDRAERYIEKQASWERKHGWKTFFVNWGGMYGNGTELILCCPEAYVATLLDKIASLECSPAAITDEAVTVEIRKPATYVLSPREVV